jgi:hypothetical protein
VFGAGLGGSGFSRTNGTAICGAVAKRARVREGPGFGAAGLALGGTGLGAATTGGAGLGEGRGVTAGAGLAGIGATLERAESAGPTDGGERATSSSGLFDGCIVISSSPEV